MQLKRDDDGDNEDNRLFHKNKYLMFVTKSQIDLLVDRCPVSHRLVFSITFFDVENSELRSTSTPTTTKIPFKTEHNIKLEITIQLLLLDLHRMAHDMNWYVRAHALTHLLAMHKFNFYIFNFLSINFVFSPQFLVSHAIAIAIAIASLSILHSLSLDRSFRFFFSWFRLPIAKIDTIMRIQNVTIINIKI